MLNILIIFLSILNINAYSLVALKQKNVNILEERLINISNPLHSQYGKYWSETQINELISPDQDEIDNLLTYFKKNNINCIQKGGDVLECDNIDDKCLKRIPSIVHFIEKSEYNIINYPSIKSQDNSNFVGREVMVELYNISHNNIINNNISICAVEYQGAGGFNETDLLIQQNLNNESEKNITTIIGENQGVMLESQLDVQMMSQVAENVNIWFWQGEEWLYTFATRFLNSSNIPDVLSMSWGWSAKEQCSNGLGICPGNMTSAEYIKRVNIEYIKMGLRGVSVTVSSGDAGAPGRTNENCILNLDDALNVNPAFPGSSPYITSVSATYIVSDNKKSDWKTPLCQKWGCASGSKEMPCNFDYTGWTTGGGFAIFNETRPIWQKKEVERYLKSNAKRPENFQKNGRGYPDVSALGHNCPVVVNGIPIAVDGTSCSSPVFAAIIALLNDHQITKGKAKLGFINPLLYKMYNDNPRIFNDITEGNNKCTESMCCNYSFGYEATEGWDPVTGLGTPNVGLMLEWLDKNT